MPPAGASYLRHRAGRQLAQQPGYGPYRCRNKQLFWKWSRRSRKRSGGGVCGVCVRGGVCVWGWYSGEEENEDGDEKDRDQEKETKM